MPSSRARHTRFLSNVCIFALATTAATFLNSCNAAAFSSAKTSTSGGGSVSPPPSYWTSEAIDKKVPSSILKKIQESPWRGGLEPGLEISEPTECEITQGSLPDDLVGTLFRNGPGRMRIGESIYKMWFDGDGYVSKLSFKSSSSVKYQSAYVKTDRYRNEMGNTGENGFRERGAWTDALQGKWFQNLFKKPTNPGNTSCRLIKTKQGQQRMLLALAEGGPPHLLDPTTLETLGLYDFGVPEEFGSPADCATAHPSDCPITGEMYTCGLRMGVPSAWPSLTQLKAFKFVPKDDDSLELERTTTIDMPTIAFVHDMAISKNHVIFIIPPFEAQGKELLSSVLSTPPLGARFKWNPDKGTRVVVLQRSDMSIVADVVTEEYLSLYHIVNAKDLSEDEDGLVQVFVAAHTSPRKNVERVFSDMYNEVFTDNERCKLVSVKVRNGGVSVEDCGPKDASAFELPTIHPSFVGKGQRYVFTNAAFPSSAELLNCVEKLDLQTGEVDRATFGPTRYAGEPVIAPRETFPTDELNAYVLTLVYDSIAHATDCVVLDARNLAKGPIATIRLPVHAPLSFHGLWAPNELFLN